MFFVNVGMKCDAAIYENFVFRLPGDLNFSDILLTGLFLHKYYMLSLLLLQLICLLKRMIF